MLEYPHLSQVPKQIMSLVEPIRLQQMCDDYLQKIIETVKNHKSTKIKLVKKIEILHH